MNSFAHNKWWSETMCQEQGFIAWGFYRTVIVILTTFYGTIFAEKRFLDVHITPMLPKATPPFTLNRQVQLRCDVIAYPPIGAYNVVWLYGDEAQRIYTSFKYTIYRNPPDGTYNDIRNILTINGITETDLGVYSCEAKNTAGMYSRRSVDLSKVGKKHIQVQELDYLKSETKTGEFVTIHSNITHVTRTSYAPGNVTQNVTVIGHNEDNSSHCLQLETTVTILVLILARLLFHGG